MRADRRLNIVRSVAKHDQFIGLESAFPNRGLNNIRVRLGISGVTR